MTFGKISAVALAIFLIAVGPEPASARRLCFRGDALRAMGTGSGISSCTQVNNSSGKSTYSSWSCPNGGQFAVQGHFDVPETLASNAKWTSVEVFWRASTAMVDPNGVCWQVSAVANLPGTAGFSYAGALKLDDVIGNEVDSGDNALPLNSANIKAVGASGLTFKQVLTALTLRLQSATPGSPGNCTSNACSGLPAVALISRTPLCSFSYTGSAEILRVCFVE